VSETGKQPQKKALLFDTYKAVFIGGGVTGCVIILIVAAALVIGFWLDGLLESANHIYTFGSIILSVPVTFAAIIWVVRLISSRMRPSDTEEFIAHNELQEDE